MLEARLTVYYCREDNTGECLLKTFVWAVSLEIKNGAAGKSEIVLTANANRK